MMTSMTVNGRQQQQGLSLVMAVFILVVLALLGAAMVNILTAGSESVAREVISTRALFAAESGAQRKLNEIFVAGSAIDPGQCASNAGEVRTTNYNGGTVNTATYVERSVLAGLFACDNVSVDCSYVTINTTNYFTISSTGRCGPSNEPAVRVVEVQAKDSL